MFARIGTIQTVTVMTLASVHKKCHTPMLDCNHNQRRKMSDLEIVENITKNKCAICGDKLTAWENSICILCED